MGFRKDSFARIWSVEDKGNYSIANVSISRKNKETNQYEVEFQDGFVRLVGNAHEFMKGVLVPQGGFPVKITSCDVTNKYSQEKKQTYTNYVIFGLEAMNFSGNATAGNASTAKKAAPKAQPTVDEDDNPLPF